MGVFESKNEANIYTQSVKYFTDVELTVLQSTFCQITKNVGDHFDRKDLEVSYSFGLFSHSGHTFFLHPLGASTLIWKLDSP